MPSSAVSSHRVRVRGVQGHAAMLATLGARSQVDEVVEVLTACHRNIRHHFVIARRLVVRGPQCELQEVRDIAAQIRHYFGVALPLHVADEEQTIAPRLCLDPSVATLVKRLTRDHAHHQSLVDTLVALCGEVEQAPERLSAINGRLSKPVELLATDLAMHLELEERLMFPLVRSLPLSVRSEMHTEIRRRRDGALTNSA